MAVQLRGGNEVDLDKSKLLPREPIITEDSGKLIFCYGAGLTHTCATIEEVQALLAVSPQAYTALQQLISDLSNQTVLTGLLADVATLFTISVEATGYGVISGLTVSAQTTPNMTVKAITGTIHMPSGKRFTPTANSSIAVTAANATNPRIDIVYVSSAGVISYLAGTAAASPTAPTVPSGGLVLAQISVAANATTIASGNITDKRQIKYSNVDLKTQINAKLDKTGDASNTTNSFTQASTLANLTTGEKLAISLGKVMKFFAFIGTTALTTTATTITAAINELVTKIGTLSSLTTTEKTNLVGALNEVNSNLANLYQTVTVNLTTINQAYQNDRLKTCKKVTLRWNHAAGVYLETTITVAGNTFASAYINSVQCGGYATWSKTAGTITLNNIVNLVAITAITMEG